MAGLFTRLVALGFVIEMVVAILSTKISLFLGTSPLAVAGLAAQGGHLGRSTRGALRVGAADDLAVSVAGRTGPLVARRAARWQNPSPTDA